MYHSEYNFDQLDAMRAEARTNGGRAIFNSFSQPSSPVLANLPQGLQFFDYEIVGRNVQPVITPMANRLTRRTNVSGTAMFYREITDININKTLPYVSEGNRGAIVDRATRDRVNKFAGLGYENVNTFESMYAARGVANPRDLARMDAMKALKIAEEPVILYGNYDQALGTPTNVVVSDAGAIAGATTTGRTVVARVVLLTGDGFSLSSVVGGVATTVTKNNTDGSTDTIPAGSSLPSVASAGVAITATHGITLKCDAHQQARAYAWYTGTASATCRLVAITEVNFVTLTADEGGAAQLITAITADNTANPLAFNGMLSIIGDKEDNGNKIGYYKSYDGASLTATSDGNVSQIVTAFFYFYTKYYASPTELIMHPLTALEVTKIVLGGPAAAIYQRMLQNQTGIDAGFSISRIFNPFTGQFVPITTHPFWKKGNVVLWTESMPYPIEGMGNVWELATRQPFYVIEWPLRTRRNEVGIYVDEGLKCELLFMQGMIDNLNIPDILLT